MQFHFRLMPRTVVILLGIAILTPLQVLSCDNTTEFDCQVGSSKRLCIPLEWMCDNIWDCDNGLDEYHCSYLHECRPGFMICRDGECVQSDYKCDGEWDCSAGDDEMHCKGYDTSHLRGESESVVQSVSHILTDEECPAPKFKCKNGPCMIEWVICDGMNDCPLGDDEVNCTGSHSLAPEICHTNSVLCADQTACVPKSWICDGNEDCADGSDEADCDIPNLDSFLEGLSSIEMCKPNELRCRGSVHKCIPITKTCDGTMDCPDGDDEGPQCDQCREKGCEYQCHNTPQGARCECPYGSVLSDDGVSCPDIDECHSAEGKQCQHYCENRKKAYQCTCAPGYQLGHDGHSCRLDRDHEGMLFISLGSEIRRMPLFEARTSQEGYSTVQFLGSHGTVRSIDYLNANQKIYLAIGGSSMDGEIGVSSGGLLRVIRENVIGVGQIAVDWIGGNIYYTQKYPSISPGITVCVMNGFFCRKVIHGLPADDRDASRRQSYRGLALHPLRGTMVWIDSFNGRHKIMMANMDGTSAHTLVDNKLDYPSGISVDSIKNDVYFGDVDKEMIEKVNMDSGERTVVLTSGVHHPYDLAYFNGFVYWSDWESESLKVAELSIHHSSAHVIHSFNRFPYGIAINHTLYQPTPSSANPCSTIDCPWICVAILNDGLLEANCLCPDNYIVVDGDCLPHTNRSNIEVAHIGVALMKEYCDAKIGCLNGGTCEDIVNEHGRLAKIMCSCSSPYEGDHCERLNLARQAADALVVTSGNGWTAVFVTLAFLIILAAAFIFAYQKSKTLSEVTKTAVSRIQQIPSPRLPNVRPIMESFRNRIPTLPTSVPRAARTEVARSDFDNPLFAGDSSAETSPAAIRGGTATSFSNHVYADVTHAAPFSGIEVSYSNKFVH